MGGPHVLRPGSHVRILTGSLRGQTGIIESLEDDRQVANVAAERPGGDWQTCEVDYDQLEVIGPT